MLAQIWMTPPLLDADTGHLVVWPEEPTGRVTPFALIESRTHRSGRPRIGLRQQRRTTPQHRRYTELVAIKMKVKRGRPLGPKMPFGWSCGSQLTASEMRLHFTRCSKRPKRAQWMTRMRCRCCAAGYESPVEAVSPLCTRCRSGRCRTCAWRLGVPSVDLGGRPSGPRMPCSWGCGAKLSATEMRAHFTRCPKRP